MENVENVQNLIFLCELKLNQNESEIMKMPYWVLKKRIFQYETYQKEFMEVIKKAITEATKSIGGGGSMPSFPRIPMPRLH